MAKPAQRIRLNDEENSSYSQPLFTGWELGARHLRLVLAIHQTGGLAKAATRFHVTPSALSHQLRQLERRCGLLLFDRVGSKLVINRAGRLLLEAAESVLPNLATAQSRLERLAQRGPEIVSLSTECYTCYHWLPRALHELRQRFEGTEFRIRADVTRQPLDALLRGELDVAIVSQELPAAAHLVAEPIFRDEMVVIAAPHHPLARSPYARRRDFCSLDALVYSADPKVSALLGDVLVPAGVTPRRVTEVPLTEAIVELVKAGEGVGFLARWAVQHHLDPSSMVALSLGKEGFFREWQAVCAASSPVRPMLSELAAIMRRQMGG